MWVTLWCAQQPYERVHLREETLKVLQLKDRQPIHQIPDRAEDQQDARHQQTRQHSHQRGNGVIRHHIPVRRDIFEFPDWNGCVGGEYIWQTNSFETHFG